MSLVFLSYEIFTQYRGTIYAVDAYIEVSKSHPFRNARAISAGECNFAIYWLP